MRETLPHLLLRASTRPCQPSSSVLRELILNLPVHVALLISNVSPLRGYVGVQLIAHKPQAVKEKPWGYFLPHDPLEAYGRKPNSSTSA